MFLIIGLILLSLFGLVFVLSTWGTANNLSKGKNIGAVLLVIPAALIGTLFVWGIIYGQWKAQPYGVYQSAFGTLPPASISNLQVYYDDDEFGGTYLQFNAPPSTLATLLKGKFSSSPGSVPHTWNSLPSQFYPSIAPTTRIYRKNGASSDTDGVLLYDPNLQLVRFYSR